MINIEKERKAFEAYMNRDECEKDDIFTAESNGWIARAMFENKEIEKLASKHGSAIGKLHFTERKLGEAQQEIEATKRELDFATKTISNLLKKITQIDDEAQQEISHLKNANHHLSEINEDISNTILYLREKLEKIESGDFVLVPRKANQQVVGAFWDYWLSSHPSQTMVDAWEEMIEAGEIK